MKERCLMCFASRSTDFYPGTRIGLCRGCKYQVDKLIGFWETQGYGMQLQFIDQGGPSDLVDLTRSTEEGEGGTPPTPQESMEEAPSGDETVMNGRSSARGPKTAS